MNCFPTHDLENRPVDPARYVRVLETASGHETASPGASHGLPGGTDERWSVEDAAAYWCPAWQPAEQGKVQLSADAITGLVATAFHRNYGDLPLLRKFFWILHTKIHVKARSVAAMVPLDSIRASLFCRAAYVGFRPGVLKLDEKFSRTGFRAVASKTLRPCSQECCREAGTILGGCISRESFDNALSSGVLLPVRTMNVSPITLLLPRLACWEKNPPWTAVSAGEAHTKALYAPYWVHDAINNMARLIPALLARPDVRAEIRASVERWMPSYLDMRKELKTDELRENTPAGTPVSRDEYIANMIWQSSRVEPAPYRQGWPREALPPQCF